MHDESVDEIADESSATMVDPAFARAQRGRRPRWTFQVVEEYDDGYWSTFRRLEAVVRQQLADGRRHRFEADMKEDRQVRGGSRPPSS